MKNVTFYRTAAGRCAVEDFLDSLPPKEAQKVTWVLKLVEDLDIVPITYLKVLTHAMMKKTQKTPRGEIEKAQACRKDFLNRRQQR
jgi:hypothetical protein